MNPSRITALLQRARGHQALQNQLALWQCVSQAQQPNRPGQSDLSCTRQPRQQGKPMQWERDINAYLSTATGKT